MQRRPVNQDQILESGIIGVDTIFERGQGPALFFCVQGCSADECGRQSDRTEFDLAAQPCADLTPLVYRRLFRLHPETEAMFRAQGSELAMGPMLAFAILAILDRAGERQGHSRLIGCEVASHDG
jgi:hypothetical protein